MELNLPKEQQLLLLALIASLVVGLGVMAIQNISPASSDKVSIETPKHGHIMAQEAAKPTIMVHVCGAVRREGVYKLNPGDRLIDAVKLAGGARPAADLTAVNLAEAVKDGQKIVVPAKQLPVETHSEPVNVEAGGKQRSKLQGPININTADEKTLDSLPGVGPATAKAIIEYRKTKGPFARIEQIMEIPRFGKSKFERIKGLVII
jgi:competence protein ComEA